MRAMANKRLVCLGVALALYGCGPKEDNSPEMGAVAPKPNFGASSHAPNSANSRPQLGADAAAMGQLGKKR